VTHSPSGAPRARGLSVSNEWTFRDIEATVMEGEEMRVVLLQGKGADISEVVFKPLNLNVLFRNPWGPRNPRLYPTIAPHASAFRDYTGGGWSDILPNAGDACTVKGARFALHDETPLLNWSSSVEEASPDRVSALFRVKLVKYPFEIRKLVSLETGNRLTITETVRNESRERLPFSWLVHPAFSPAFAEPSAPLELHARWISVMGDARTWDYPAFVDVDGIERDASLVPSAETKLDSTLVLGGLDAGRYSITNPALGLRFTLAWDKEVFPFLWYYRSLGAEGYPFYGRSRFIALEPSTSRVSGLAAQVAADDARWLEADESLTTEMVATLSRV